MSDTAELQSATQDLVDTEIEIITWRHGSFPTKDGGVAQATCVRFCVKKDFDGDGLIDLSSPFELTFETALEHNEENEAKFMKAAKAMMIKKGLM